MTNRLKRHKSGSRLTLREDDLLNLLIMPSSSFVHLVRMIVSKNGDLEFAEWIAGEIEKYSHKNANLGSEKLAKLIDRLSALNAAEQAINFGAIDFEYDDYEGTERRLVRYWVGQKEREAYLLTPEFYKDFGISRELQDQFEIAFDSVCSELPLDWMS